MQVEMKMEEISPVLYNSQIRMMVHQIQTSQSVPMEQMELHLLMQSVERGVIYQMRTSTEVTALR